jgi:hypothetical protein
MSKGVRWTLFAPAPELIQCRDFNPSWSYPQTRIAATAWITAEIIGGEKLSWRPDLFQITVPWRSPFSQSVSLCLGWIFSQFYVVTWSSLFSKVIALGSSYNLGIATLGKFLLDHAWIRAQSSCSCTVSLKFRLQTAWQPIFGCIFLQFLHNNHAYSLKQSYSPLIGLQYWCGDLGKILFIWKLQGLKVESIILKFRLNQKGQVWLFCK